MITAWMTRQEAADHLRVSVDTIDRYARDGKVTKYNVAGTRSVRYKTAELDALLTPEDEEGGCDHMSWEHDTSSFDLGWICANCGCPIEKVETTALALVCGHAISLVEPISDVRRELAEHNDSDHLDRHVAA